MHRAKKKALTAASEKTLLAAEPDTEFIAAWAAALETAINAAWAEGYLDMQRQTDAIAAADPDAPTATTFEASKTVSLRWGNKDAAAYHKAKSFISAIITDAELSGAVQQSLSDALAEGKSLRTWKTGLDDLFAKKGFAKIGNWHAETIFRTETSLAYNAGSNAKLIEVADTFPYWEYVTAGDERVRDEHAALNSKIFKTGDTQYYPPLGINCRCRTKPVSKWAAKRRGIEGPDTVTPEMRSNLRNAEFIGDKTKSFEDYLNAKLETLDAKRTQLIIETLAKIKESLDTTATTATATATTQP